VLYPTELRGHRTHIINITFTTRCFFVIIVCKERSIVAPSNIHVSKQDKFGHRPIFWAVIVSAGLLSGCSASDFPLSINLYNPKTGVQRTCVATESSSKDVAVLSNAVETCAKQLEARGFVRSDNR
jgi:hypothetical protein